MNRKLSFIKKCHARFTRASGRFSRPSRKTGVTAKAKTQSGNMLIYILGAIFLMGLLIVALKGSFQEGSGIDPEKIGIVASQVQRYGAELERGVSYVLRNGYSEADIRFGHPNSPSHGLITDIPARQVFAPEGGGVEWRSPPSGLQTSATPWAYVGRNTVPGVGTTCAANTCTDLIAMIFNIPKEFCLRINDLNGITNTGGNPPADPDAFDAGSAFINAGSYTYAASINPPGNENFGKMEGCVSYTSGITNYYYYRVLLAR